MFIEFDAVVLGKRLYLKNHAMYINIIMLLRTCTSQW